MCGRDEHRLVAWDLGYVGQVGLGDCAVRSQTLALGRVCSDKSIV